VDIIEKIGHSDDTECHILMYSETQLIVTFLGLFLVIRAIYRQY